MSESPSKGPPPLPPSVLAYAVPFSSTVPAPGELWRDGKLLVAPTFARLPYVCVKCNQPVPEGTPGSKRLTQKLAWHHPALYFLILPGVLIYAIVVLAVQKKATVELSLCPVHNGRRVRWLVFTWVTVVGGLGLIGLGCGGGSAWAKSNDMWPAWVMLGGLLIALLGGIIGATLVRPITPARINDVRAWIKGVSPELLATLPGA
jgi:hypothetical protein